jgi:ferric-dicitrate binding protein FerR (iron transport regulator)
MTSLGSRGSRSDDAVDRLSDLAREVAHAPIDAELDRAGRARLLFNVRREIERPKRRFGAPLLLAAALSALLAVGVHRLWPKPLSYEVHGARLDGPYVSASEKPVRVEFSDGSVVRADPGSRLRVDDTQSDGARVLIERGRAAVSVAHNPGSQWSFLGGPFEVRVVGTHFEVDWDPAGEVLELRMREGTVEVHGPLGGAVTVRGGQRFRAELVTRRMTVIDAGEGVAVKDPRSNAPVAAPSEAEGAEPSPQPEPNRERTESPSGDFAASPTVTARESWPKLVANGDFDLVVEQANDRGLEGCLRTCNASDLRALADAARYTSRSDLAERALTSLRHRFPGSAESRAAGFLLGRVTEARGAHDVSQRWYETYLTEAPSGTLAAEALAGKMRTILATRGRAAAQPVARDYLSRYPEGVHAKSARRLLGEE